MRIRKNIWILTLIAGLAGGTIPTYSKIALESMSSGTLTVLRYAFTFLVLVGISYAARQPISWKRIVGVLPVSLFAAVNAICFAIGIRYVQAASVQLLYTDVPIIVAILSWLFLHQSINSKKIIGLVVGLSGVVFVVVAPLLSRGQGLGFHPLGSGIIILGSISYAIYSVLSKPAQDKATPTDMLLGTSVATIAAQILYSVFTQAPLTLSGISLRSLLASLVVGLLGTTLLYWLYQYIVKVGSPLLASATLYIQPVAGALLAFLVLGEHLSLLTIIGGAIALAGVAQLNSVWSRLFKKPTTNVRSINSGTSES